MLPGRTFTLGDVARIVVRYRWLVLLPFSFGLAMAPVIARHVPELYRSDTLIMVIPQRVPDSYVRSTITGTIADRLPSISEQILSRSRLERIITEFDLYAGERATGIMQDIVERMRRNDITVNAEGRESFRISYASRDPQTARQVAARLASLYIEENLRDRQVQAEATSTFLESELEEARTRLMEQERRLEAYQIEHAGQLPAQRPANLQAIQNAQMQLQALSDSINRARERRFLVERELGEVRSLPVLALTSAAAAGGPSIAQRLDAERTRLDQVKRRYLPGHPDVRSAERAVRELEAQLEEERARPQPDEARARLTPEDVARLARERRVGDLEAELRVIDRQLAAGEDNQTQLKQVIADYQARIDATPTREAELIELTRDYETLQSSYRSLLAKREDSQLAASLERQQIGEQFRVLDPASLPSAPDNLRQRTVMTFSGAAGGLLLGLALIAYLVWRDRSFSADDEVVRLLGLPVLAQVPAMPSPRARVVRRRRRLALDVAGAAGVVGSAASLIIWWLRP